MDFCFAAFCRTGVVNIPLARLLCRACPPSKGDFGGHGLIPPLKGDTGGCPAVTLRTVSGVEFVLGFWFCVVLLL